jgi:hypothetical protein
MPSFDLISLSASGPSSISSFSCFACILASPTGLGKLHRKPASAQVAPEILTKQHLYIRLIINHENEQPHARPFDLPDPGCSNKPTLLTHRILF